MRMTIVVNLFAGPGAGKSTTAAGVFHALKIRGINAELITEYAKDLTWEDRANALANQPLILGKQFHRMWRVKNKVDVIITDSPLLLSILYNHDKLKHLPALVEELHHSFSNMNYLIQRKKKYIAAGRNQTAEEAAEYDGKIEAILQRFNIEYSEIPGNEDGLITLVEDVVAKLAC